MAKIFVSYSRASKDIVEELVQDLTSDDHEIWFDQHLTGGQKWWDNILSEIRKCEIFVVALTLDSLESLACRREAKYASDLQKILLPVRLSNRVLPNSLPPALSELQWVDYSHPDKQALKNLQRTLRQLPKAPPLPDPLPDAPLVPISYLSNLRSKIDTDSQLQLQDQIQLVFELRRQFRNGDPAKEILELLQRLKKRDDLFAKVAEDIDQLIREIGTEPPIGDQSPPPQPELPGPEDNHVPPEPEPAAASIASGPQIINPPVSPNIPDALPVTGGGGNLREPKKSFFGVSTAKAIFIFSLLATGGSIIGFYAIITPSQRPNEIPLLGEVVKSGDPLEVKVLGAIYTVPDRKLQVNLVITNRGKEPVKLGEFQSAGLRFLNPEVYMSKINYPENLVAGHGLSLSDNAPIQPGETRVITFFVQDNRQSDRLSYDVNKSPPSLLYFFTPSGYRYEVDIGGFK